MTILKAAKNRAFTVSLEDIVFEKPQGGLGEGGGCHWILVTSSEFLFVILFGSIFYVYFILFYFILFF